MDFITGKVVIISLFIMLITMIETLAYSTRISGARVKLIATALSLFSTLVVISRFSTMIQQPLTAKLIAEVPKHSNPLSVIEEQYRVLIWVTTIGVLFGILLFPTFINIFSRGIVQLSYQRGSVIGLFFNQFNKDGIKKVWKCVRIPRLSYLNGITLKTIPKRLFVFNVIVSAVFTIGVLSSMYASMLVPKYSQAALMSSGIINGIATILLTLFIDPKASVLADRVMKKQVDYVYLKSYSLTMISSKFVGTIAAQLLFLPAAYYVAWFAKWI
ncbi:lipid II flippase Amj family protein [Falsibacillus pallidus]|uniref:lipid II flippase Amj family protein n=1 Tax=Falsibacillus pallidus TaxID=493781 RepID=UPI003D971866